MIGVFAGAQQESTPVSEADEDPVGIYPSQGDQ